MDRHKINQALYFIRGLEKQEGENRMTRTIAFREALDFYTLNDEEKRVLGNMLQIPSPDRV